MCAVVCFFLSLIPINQQRVTRIQRNYKVLFSPFFISVNTFRCLFCYECAVILVHSFICFSCESFFTSVERRLAFPHLQLSAEASLSKPHTHDWLLSSSLGNRDCFLFFIWRGFGRCLTLRLFLVHCATQFLHFVWHSNSAFIMGWCGSLLS